MDEEKELEFKKICKDNRLSEAAINAFEAFCELYNSIDYEKFIDLYDGHFESNIEYAEYWIRQQAEWTDDTDPADLWTGYLRFCTSVYNCHYFHDC